MPGANIAGREEEQLKKKKKKIYKEKDTNTCSWVYK